MQSTFNNSALMKSFAALGRKRPMRLATVLGTVALAFGQEQSAQPPAPAAPSFRTVEQQYKNIKVMTGMRADQMNLGMHGLVTQLGVDCVHCHIWEEWEKDVKPPKQIARRMITMVRDMNQKYFGGAQVVTCYTCHRGQLHPVNTTILPDTIGLRKPGDPVRALPTEEEVVPKPAYPSVESILSKYVEALGGEAAVRKVNSRVIRAKRDLPSGPGGLIVVPAEVEIYQKAPNLAVMIQKTEKFTIAEGFDGSMAWAQAANGNVNNLPEPDQSRARRSANVYEPIELQKNYDSMTVTGLEKVNGRDSYVVSSYPVGDTVERLYFDVQTGLLNRKWTSLPTSLGLFPQQIDYDNYRKTPSGMMFPYTIRSIPGTARVEPTINSTIEITDLRENVNIEASRFSRPTPPPKK
ncbi:MAG: c-type cytochrome [Bryobacteraceae bacterium]